jgi:hypothetical protein
MNNTNDLVGGTTGLSILQRARFGPGMLLQHEDLEQLNTYTRDLSRLLFQSFFGCGVVCGLVVKADPDCGKLKVTVEPGLALACSGDPVYVPPGVQPFYTHDDFNLATAKTLWVVLCGTTKCCAPRTTTCCSDDDEATSDCTREKDGFEIRLVNAEVPPTCVCGCTKPEDPYYKPRDETLCQCADPRLKCYEDHYKGNCVCTCGECTACDCKCILLARLDSKDQGKTWNADHRVRRFIRPVLISDQQIARDKAALASDPATDPQTAPLFDQLSGQHYEKEMARIRETWKSFSADERAQVRYILDQYPQPQKANQLREILEKYHDVKLGPSPRQNRDLTSLLAADLAQARKRRPRPSTSRKTMQP